ncbi:MAG: class I tRNA ligase family protein, partial [Candidatus Micrarchaeota archaeon]
MAGISHQEIEAKWQKKWLEAGLGKVNVGDKSKPSFFMHFAYPTVSGYQHVGHMRGYSYTDMVCRYKRMAGHNVFFPVGSHASGNAMLGFAKKIERNDQKFIDYLLSNGYPKEKLNDMKNANKAVDYFNENYKQNWKIMGFIPDFDSFTCTTYPDYGKFIEWQFRKLKDKGLLIQQPYFATFCPNCGPVSVDPAEMDVSKGGSAEKHEYTLIKFRFEKDGQYIIAATLRPETMYGQTNLWVDPNVEYVKAKVGGEIWVCSAQCAEKLKNQKEKAEVVGKIKGAEMLGKKAHAPSVERDILILPSKFCDPAVGTGIVTSVPSDAPYDWMALYDLQRNEPECRKYGINPAEVKALKPIPIIESKDYGNLPAVKICEQMKIKDQNDPKLEEATKLIYKTGFHTGVLNGSCGEYAGQAVERAKESMKQKLIDASQADVMYDLSEEVICRCGKPVTIKIVPDQWFINYADRQVTKDSKEHAETMNIMPDDYKRNMPGVLDWFKERAATRLGNWLGT